MAKPLPSHWSHELRILRYYVRNAKRAKGGIPLEGWGRTAGRPARPQSAAPIVVPALTLFGAVENDEHEYAESSI